jgi:hypothetical protein
LMHRLHVHIGKHSQQQSCEGIRDFGSEASIHSKNCVLRHDPEIRH